METLHFDTKAIHGSVSKPDVHRSIRYPVYAGVAYDFETAEDIEAAFAWRKPAHSYSRISNPTVEAFERKISTLEEGFGSVALSSGMAAISNVLLNLLKQGDNLVASRFLFGNTYSLLESTLPSLGIETRFVDITQPAEVEKAVDENTRLIFLETITNPQMIVPDVTSLVEIARAHKLVVVVDGTVTTPYLFQAKNRGVDIVVHSTTKFISGGATSIGGVVVDLGNFDWGDYSNLVDYRRFGQGAFIARLRKEVYRNLGACMAPQTAYLQSLGLETLSLRVDRSCQNALKIAEFLQGHKGVLNVHYPGLPSSRFHKVAEEQFKGRFGGVLSFDLYDKKIAFEFLNRLKLIRRATNLNDNVSLVLHPASTIYCDFSAEERAEMAIGDGLIRLSAGLEDAADLMADIQQAMDGIR
ncbi:MAG: O-acetylhomoserine aminocarboxypropyltransferase/cysteine synthase [Proteobacteria bacterium]|nr:O-acetylhomoserine aminocarboxypropyltransferase/cysteine synthase [Pseudomonadota bacterium]